MRSYLFALLTVGALVAPVLAQPAANSQSPQPGMMMQRPMMQNGMMGANMRGMHAMTVTVTALDAKTGLVDASSGDMALKLHFPPSALAGIKAGDKLSVHLAFTKS